MNLAASRADIIMAEIVSGSHVLGMLSAEAIHIGIAAQSSLAIAGSDSVNCIE